MELFTLSDSQSHDRVMSSEISQTYAVVNKAHDFKKKRAPLPDQINNDPVPSVYAEVNKKQKKDTMDDNYDLIAPPEKDNIHNDQVSDVYAQVNKTGKSITMEDSEDNYDWITQDNLNYNIVSHETAHDPGLYDLAIAASSEGKMPKYPKPSNVIAKINPYREKISKPAWVLACLIILTIIVIAVAIATIFALALTTKLQSELENYSIIELNRKINNLHSEFDVFSTNTTSQLITLKSVTDESGFIQMLNKVSQSLFQLKNNTNEIITNITIIEMNLRESLISGANHTSIDLSKLGEQVSEKIANASASCQESIGTLTAELSLSIQAHHMFDSCDAVANNSLPLPSGMYMIGSTEDTAAMQYCITDVSYSCNGTAGVWKRVAYLNTQSFPMQCPEGFKILNNSNISISCTPQKEAVCTSVTFKTHGISYSHICGTMRGSYTGNPDGFVSHNAAVRLNDTMQNLLDSNYLDGVSLTYNNETLSKQHIWSFTARTCFKTNCSNNYCTKNKPTYVGTDYSCEEVRECYLSKCKPKNIWDDSSFHKALENPGSSDIEMRVCVDQHKADEEIVLSYVEVYIT